MTLSEAMQRLRAQRPQPTGPIGGVYDPRFKYRPSYNTDVRQTIDREFIRANSTFIPASLARPHI